MFYREKGGSFGLTSPCFTTKKGSILDPQFITKKGSFGAEKSVLSQKGGHFQTGEQGWVPFFPVSEGARSTLLVRLTVLLLIDKQETLAN